MQQEFDINLNGIRQITIEEVREYFKEFAENLTDEEILQIIPVINFLISTSLDLVNEKEGKQIC